MPTWVKIILIVIVYISICLLGALFNSKGKKEGKAIFRFFLFFFPWFLSWSLYKILYFITYIFATLAGSNDVDGKDILK